MNVYEEAHNLSRAIKESEEYKHYKAAADKLKEKPELDKMIKDFMEKQIKIQTKQMLGERNPKTIGNSYARSFSSGIHAVSNEIFNYGTGCVYDSR